MRIFVKNSGYPEAIIGGDTCPDGYTERSVEEYRALVAAAGLPPPPAEVPLVPQVPSSVTRKQLLISLVLRHGIRYEDIQAKLALLYPDPSSIERYVAECHLEDSQVFERTHALVAAIAQMFALTSDQVDQIFIFADTVS